MRIALRLTQVVDSPGKLLPEGSRVEKVLLPALIRKREGCTLTLQTPFLAHYKFDVRSSGNVAGDGSLRTSTVGQFDIPGLLNGPPAFKDHGPARPKSRSGDLDVPRDHGGVFPLIRIHIRTAVAVVRGFEGYGTLGILGHGSFFQESDVAHDLPGGTPKVSVDGHSLKSWITNSGDNGNNGQGDAKLQDRESLLSYPSIPHLPF